MHPVPVEASLHRDFGRTASFMLLPERSQLQAIRRKLKESNAEWQKTNQSGEQDLASALGKLPQL
jgi:hypothetical protein